MIAEKQAKIALEAKTVRGGVRLSKSRVALSEEECPVVVSKPGDLPSRYNPVPLLRFFALWKLHSIQKKPESFHASSEDYKWATQLYDLIKNCGKKETCWLERVFGSHRNAPRVCLVHKVIRAFKDGRECVVASAKNAPAPDEIRLVLDGTPAEAESELIDFLQRLGGAEEKLALPDSNECETPPMAGPLAADPDSDGNQQGHQFRSFPNCGIAQHDFGMQCVNRLGKAGKLTIKWLGMGMEFGEHYLRELLEQLTSLSAKCEIKVQVAMLDPAWEGVRHLNIKWPGLARAL